MKMLKRLLVAALLIAIILMIASFISQNAEKIEIDFLSYKTVPLAKYIVILMAFLSGALVSAILLLGDILRKAVQIRRLEKQIRKSPPLQFDIRDER